MKREIASILEQDQIAEWLISEDKVHDCPFGSEKRCIWDEGYIFCKKFFPRLKEACPCKVYSLKYVKRVARGLIKEK